MLKPSKSIVSDESLARAKKTLNRIIIALDKGRGVRLSWNELRDLRYTKVGEILEDIYNS